MQNLCIFGNSFLHFIPFNAYMPVPFAIFCPFRQTSANAQKHNLLKGIKDKGYVTKKMVDVIWPIKKEGFKMP